MRAAQSRTLNYSHPIDAMAVALVQGMEAEARSFWEATYQPHVMKVKRPPLRDLPRLPTGPPLYCMYVQYPRSSACQASPCGPAQRLRASGVSLSC